MGKMPCYLWVIYFTLLQLKQKEINDAQQNINNDLI